MNAKLKNLRKSKKGFTLVELIVVIVIIAILAAALVTSLVGYINKARQTTAIVEANNVYVATQAFISEHGAGAAIDANTTVLNTAAISAVNTYLGDNVIAAAAGTKIGAVTKIAVGANDTITEFNYTASNGNTVTFTTAAGWN